MKNRRSGNGKSLETKEARPQKSGRAQNKERGRCQSPSSRTKSKGDPWKLIVGKAESARGACTSVQT